MRCALQGVWPPAVATTVRRITGGSVHAAQRSKPRTRASRLWFYKSSVTVEHLDIGGFRLNDK